MTTCLVVEDEPLARRKLCELLGEQAWIRRVVEADTLRAARAAVREHRVAVAFLDIQLPDGRGLALLDDLDEDVIVVFTTALDDYAVTAFELQALDYLVKPFSAQRFRATLERVRRALPRAVADQRARAMVAESSMSPSRIHVRVGAEIIPLELSAIERIDGDDDHAAVWASGRRYLIYRRLKDLEAVLAPAGFLRVHRSHLVNVAKVVRLTPLVDGRLTIHLSSGARVPASRSGAATLRARLSV